MPQRYKVLLNLFTKNFTKNLYKNHRVIPAFKNLKKNSKNNFHIACVSCLIEMDEKEGNFLSESSVKSFNRSVIETIRHIWLTSKDQF